MKMMKTDMEFVNFDAQDVITTSTTITPTGISFKLTGSLFDLQDSGWHYDGYAYWFPNEGDGEFFISGSNSGVELTDENYYTIAEGAKFTYAFTELPDGGYTGGLHFYSGLTEGKNGAEEKTSLKEILGWLGVNKIIQ